jgi:thiamine biosynthesis lipoprotein
MSHEFLRSGFYQAGKTASLAFFLLIALSFPLAVWAQEDDASFRGEKRVFQAMHTRVEIQIPEGNGSADSPESLADLAEAAVLKADRLLSPHGQESDVRRLNEAAPGVPVEVDSLTVLAYGQAILWNSRTGGMFEPTIGPLKKLFSFEGEELQKWPSQEEIDQALDRVGLDKLALDPEKRTLSWKKEGGYLDLGGIAKGLAADLAAEVLEARGVRNALINVGGEMRLMGQDPLKDPPGAWVVGLIDPLGREMNYAVEISGRALASSGNYRSFFLYQGQRYSHIINPRTGLPLEDAVAGVTVVHPTSASAADAMATALCLMGPQGTEKYLREQGGAIFPRGLEVVMFLKKGQEDLETVHFSLGPDGTLKVSGA